MLDRIEPSQLVDRLEIEQLVNAYALLIDFQDIEEWVDLFTEDAFFDEREFETGLHVGHVAIRAYGNVLKATAEHASHLMANLVIRNMTENTASGIVFALVEAQMKTGERARYQVRYFDDYVKTEQGWKFSKRVLGKSFPVEDMGREQI